MELRQPNTRNRNELRLVNDQVFSPTYTGDLTRKMTGLMTTERYGISHITNEGACSWCELTTEILKLAALKRPAIPITSDQYPQKVGGPATGCWITITCGSWAWMTRDFGRKH